MNETRILKPVGWLFFIRITFPPLPGISLILSENIDFYYIPINILSLDTVDFTECDPMLRITTLWFSESISPLSETDDVVHNVFLNTNA